MHVHVKTYLISQKLYYKINSELLYSLKRCLFLYFIYSKLFFLFTSLICHAWDLNWQIENINPTL